MAGKLPGARLPGAALPTAARVGAAAAGTSAAATGAAAVQANGAAASTGAPEYAPVDPTAVIGRIAGDVTGKLAGPSIGRAVDGVLDPARYPAFGTPIGKVIPARLKTTAQSQVDDLVRDVTTNQLRGTLHGVIGSVEKPKAGLGWEPPALNTLLSGYVKGVSTAWAKLAVEHVLAPAPPPAPTPAPSPASVPASMAPQAAHVHAGAPPTPSSATPGSPTPGSPTPPPPSPPGSAASLPTPGSPAPEPTVLGKPVSAILRGAGDRAISTAISALYDQTVGPMVQRAINTVTGRGDEEVKPPTALTPGKMASVFVDSVLSSLFVREVGFPSIPGQPTPVFGTFGASLANGVIGAAWSTMYSRGLEPAIENLVNDAAGVRPKDAKDAAKLPALEHFTRAATRGVAVGATTHAIGTALQGAMVELGMSVGGIGGALVAVAGAALVGAVAGTAVDATIGPMLGRLGGSIYSWVTGKPSYEQRAKDATKVPAPSPGPFPGDPVNVPNGNPGTVPAPSAPVAHARHRRRRTGNPAVDRTAPASHVPNARLAAIARRG